MSKLALKGAGIKDNPYLIEKYEDLEQIDLALQRGESNYYLQINNINMTGIDHIPIGGSTAPPFIGHYDGGGYEIENYNSERGGFFGIFGKGNVSNLNMHDVTIEAEGGAGTGALIDVIYDSSASVEIVNCHVTGNISSESNAGGLIGLVNSDVKFVNCTMIGDVEGVSNVGGFISMAENLRIEDSFFIGTTRFLSGNSGSSGGFSGQVHNGAQIHNSFVEVEIIGADTGGGLIGRVGELEVVDSFTTGILHAETYSGGFVGDLTNSGEITSSYSLMSLKANGFCGGLVAYTKNVKFSECFFEGVAENLESYCGGLVGYGSNCEFYDCYSIPSAQVKSGGYGGGFIGFSDENKFRNCYAIGGSMVLGANSSGSFAGGFAGYMDGDDVDNCFTLGDVSAENSFAGGFSGYAENNVVIKNTYARGSVSSKVWVAGFVAYISESEGTLFVNCTSSGNVKGNDFVAGFSAGDEAVFVNCKSLTDSVHLLEGDGIHSGDFQNTKGSISDYSSCYYYSNCDFNMLGTEYFVLNGTPTNEQPVDPVGFSLSKNEELKTTIIPLICPTYSYNKCNKRAVKST